MRTNSIYFVFLAVFLAASGCKKGGTCGKGGSCPKDGEVGAPEAALGHCGPSGCGNREEVRVDEGPNEGEGKETPAPPPPAKPTTPTLTVRPTAEPGAPPAKPAAPPSAMPPTAPTPPAKGTVPPPPAPEAGGGKAVPTPPGPAVPAPAAPPTSPAPAPVAPTPAAPAAVRQITEIGEDVSGKLLARLKESQKNGGNGCDILLISWAKDMEGKLKPVLQGIKEYVEVEFYSAEGSNLAFSYYSSRGVPAEGEGGSAPPLSDSLAHYDDVPLIFDKSEDVDLGNIREKLLTFLKQNVEKSNGRAGAEKK